MTESKIRIEAFLREGLCVQLKLRPPASPEQIADLAGWSKAKSVTLPSDLIEMLRVSNGIDGFLGDHDSDGEYISLDSCGSLLKSNDAMEIKTHLPGAVFFGSNGADEGFIYADSIEAKGIYVVSMTSLTWGDAHFAGATIIDFLERGAKGDFWGIGQS